jgi:hypothetical protein
VGIKLGLLFQKKKEYILGLFENKVLKKNFEFKKILLGRRNKGGLGRLDE